MSRLAWWVGLILAVSIARATGNAIREVEDQDVERPIFDYRRNGVKINVKIVPSSNASTSSRSNRNIDDDGFPRFPFKEIGHCVIEFSLTCVQKRVARFLDTIGHLREITLFGQSVKLVRVKDLPMERVDERRMIAGPGESIDRSIDDFFDTFALRITLPRWKGKKNQIDVMMDDTDVVEGRGDKGGGGGKGGGKGGKGGGKGGGCKKMMMMMMVGLKMKMMGMIGMAAMKGMIMGGMSLMISKMMILQKLMSMKGGLLGGFGGGGGGGGNYKEIVLLTKAAGGGGGGGGGGAPPPSDSYGAPPPTGGGGGGGYDYSGGGGGGWGRSFDRRPMPFVKEYTYHELQQEPAVMVAQDIADEPTEIKSSSDNRWNREATWNYTTESPVTNQIKASQDLNKRETNTQSSSYLRPIYAQSWKNYELSRPDNSEYYIYNNVRH